MREGEGGGGGERETSVIFVCFSELKVPSVNVFAL